jgi:serine phosphatase RsbU (regulator of sigma subunit)
MKLRTQLAVAFLLLAVLPLGAIVLYSYASSEKAFRQAVWTESEILATDMETRLASTRERIRDQVTRLGDLSAMPAGGAPPLEQVVRQLQEAGIPWIESLEFIPEVDVAGLDAAGPAGTVVVSPSIPQTHLLPDIEKEARKLAALEERLAKLKVQVQFKARGKDGKEAEVVVFHADAAAGRPAGSPAAVKPRPSAADLAALEESRRRTEHLLGEELSCTVKAKEKVLGRVRAHVQAQALLHSVLGAARRDRGEIPFALDGDGNLYVVRPEDRGKLAGVPVSCEPGKDIPNWIVVTREAEEGLCFGVARPIGGSLEQMRRAAASNFAIGLGLVGLCFVGVFPLSRRITRNLAVLMAGVERIARGDLAARVPVRSGDEFGRLGEAFNHMAGELSANQERLVEQEIGRRLLEAEHARQCEELEAARRFQLSLLPRELPRRDDLGLAVHVRTATEVGGDYYDFLEGADGTLTVAIGDATGHGAAAGTMVTVVKGLFMARAGETAPREFLIHANGVLRRMQLGRMAMALAIVQIRGRRLRVSSAGMPPLLVRRAATGDVEEVCLHGTPLGSLAEAVYAEREIELAPGDTVLLMTDGFPELLSCQEEPLGYARAAELFAAEAGREPAALVAGLAAAGEAWGAGRPPGDDLTFVALRVR